MCQTHLSIKSTWDSLKTLYIWSHLDNSLIKFIHKTFICLQIEMYLLSFTKVNYSHTTSTNKSVLQRKAFAFVIFFVMKNSMVFYEQVCVRNRTLKEVATNCDSRIQRMRLWQTPFEWGLFTIVYLRNSPTVRSFDWRLLLRRIKPYITLEMRKLYYNSYILPIIDYGIILWQYAPKRKLITIANIQKRTARMILDKSWDHPSNQIFKELNWLPLQSRITYHVA